MEGDDADDVQTQLGRCFPQEIDDWFIRSVCFALFLRDPSRAKECVSNSLGGIFSTQTTPVRPMKCFVAFDVQPVSESVRHGNTMSV